MTIRPPRISFTRLLNFSTTLTLMLAATPLAPAQQPPPRPVPAALEVGKSITRQLGGGETHSYVLSLASAHFLHVKVEQRGLDVLVALYGPNGRVLSEVDTRPGNYGYESASLITETAGTFRIVVRAAKKRAAAGSYEIALKELRPVEPRDGSRIAAERLFAEGAKLASLLTTVSARQAVVKYEEALPLWRAAGERDDQARALTLIGSTYRSAGEYKKSLDALNNALSLSRAAGNGRQEALTLLGLGLTHYYMNEHKRALELTDQALAVSRTLDDRAVEADTLGIIGDVQRHLGEKQRAIDHYSRALSLWKGVGAQSAQAAVSSKLGWIYNSLGDNQKAMEFLNSAVDSYRSADLRGDAASTLVSIGSLYASSGDKEQASLAYRRALELYEQELSAARSDKDTREEGNALNNLGYYYYTLGKQDQALEYGMKALAVYRSVGDRSREGDALNNIGAVYNRLGNSRKALDFYHQSLLLWQTVNNRYRTARALRTIAGIYNKTGERQKAFDALAQALSLYRDIGDRTAAADTEEQTAGIFYLLGDKQKALVAYDGSLAVWRAVGDRGAEARTLKRVADIHSSLGDKQKALAAYEGALALSRAVSDLGGEAGTLFSIGILHDRAGERQKALSSFGKALEIWRALRNRAGESGTLLEMGFAYATLGDDRRALELLNQALAITRADNDPYGRSLALNAIGFVHGHLLKEPSKSMEFHTQALAIQEKAGGGERNKALALTGLGAAYTSKGDTKKALDYLNRSLPLSRASGDPFVQGYTFHTLGAAHASARDGRAAAQYYQQALPLWRIGFRDGEAETLSNLMALWREQGKPRLAVFFGKQAVNINQEIRANIQGLDQSFRRGFLKLKESTYRELADLLISEGRLPEAQQVLGMLKEEEYSDFTRGDGGETSSLLKRATLTAEEAEWERRYEAISAEVAAAGRERGELLAKKGRTPEEEERLKKLEQEAEVANQHFQLFLNQLAEEFSKTNAAKVDQLREAQGMQEDLRALGQGAVALYTVAGEEKYRVILITPDAQIAREYPIKAADLARKVLAFREAVQNPKTDPVPAARELYGIVVGPVAKDLEQARAETLMWSLDGTLRYLPLAALHDGKGYLVERYRNVVITLASERNLKDDPSGAWKGLGLGVAKAHAGFTSLPAVPEELRSIIKAGEAEAVAGVLPGKVMLDEAFTAESMKAELRRRYPVVHIASHFAMQPGNEQNSFLLLGDGSRLTVAEMKRATQLFGGVELLTLSACDTASGGAGGDGREVEGFGVWAQRQGAKAVVASLWPVADLSTRMLMERFYRVREAAPRASKAEALRQAQLSLLRSQSGGAREWQRGIAAAMSGGDGRGTYAHPFYWAPFILIGNWK